MCSCYYHYWHDIQFSAKLQVCNVWCISYVTFPHKCMIDVSGQNMWYTAKTLGEFEVREFKINHFMKLLISPLNFSTFGLLFEFCSAKGQKISKKKKYVVLDSSKIRMLGQFYALKIAPAFVFFGRIQYAIICFWDLLTYSLQSKIQNRAQMCCSQSDASDWSYKAI